MFYIIISNILKPNTQIGQVSRIKFLHLSLFGYLGEFVGLVDTCFPPLGLSFTKFRQEANLDSKAYNTQKIFFSSQVQEQIIIFYFLKTRCMFHICIVLGKVFRSRSLHKEHDRLTISSLLNGYAKTNIPMYKYIFISQH